MFNQFILIIMKTHVVSAKKEINDVKTLKTNILVRWASNYINAMTIALYPKETRGVESKNDIHRIFYK